MITTIRKANILRIVAMLSIIGGVAEAQTPPLGGTLAPPPPVVAPSSIPNSRGLALMPATPSAPQTVVIPGLPVPGTVIDNGNGTSTLVIPGGGAQTIPTPR
jgi:hypothetical protein